MHVVQKRAKEVLTQIKALGLLFIGERRGPRPGLKQPRCLMPEDPRWGDWKKTAFLGYCCLHDEPLTPVALIPSRHSVCTG